MDRSDRNQERQQRARREGPTHGVARDAGPVAAEAGAAAQADGSRPAQGMGWREACGRMQVEQLRGREGTGSL